MRNFVVPLKVSGRQAIPCVLEVQRPEESPVQ